MKIVPLENETVDYVCKRYDENFIFPIKILGLIEGGRFRKLVSQFRDDEIEEDKLISVMESIIELGIDYGKLKSDKDELKLPWFVYDDIVSQIILLNTVCVENVKK